MHVLTILVLQLGIMWGCDGRGPHHPRGETVVKHHVHYRPTKGREQNIIQDEELLHDKQHIQEHLEEIIDQPNLENMTDEELDFYYFQVHDADRNNKLDGLEILQAIQHTHHHPHHSKDGDESNDIDSYDDDHAEDGDMNTLEDYTDLIDKVFKEDDVDNDGYLSYPEYKAGREKESKNATGRQANPLVEQPSVQMQ